jgi:hypothetical protein
MSTRFALLLVLVMPGCRGDGDAGDDGGSSGALDDSSGDAGSSSGAEGSSDAGSSEDGDSTDGSTGAEALPCDDLPVITYDTFGAGFLATYCNGCHSAAVADRRGAPPSVVFDTREQAASFATRILARREPPPDVTPMPPAGGVVAEDDEKLQIWLQCFP